MPHVGDGEIHAYLDGALDAFDDEDSARVRAHVIGCADCARRVEDARVLRDRAEAILTGGDPAQAPPPPLEELRRRATAAGVEPDPSRPSVVRGPWIAWAASIALALGTGWALGSRGLVESRVPGTLDEVAGARAVSEGGDSTILGELTTTALEGASRASAPALDNRASVAVEVDGDAAEAGVPAEARAVDEAVAEAVQDVGAGETSDVAKSTVGPTRQAGLESRDQLMATRTDRVNTPTAEPTAVPPRISELELVDSAASVSGFRSRGAAPPRALREDRVADAPSSPRRAAATEREALAQEDLEPSDPVQSRDSDAANAELRASVAPADEERRAERNQPAAGVAGGLIVPGLPVESVTVAPSSPTGALTIVQRLPGGEPLELVFTPGAAPTFGDAPAGSGRRSDGFEDFPFAETEPDWSRATVARDGGWLTARAPVPVDSLAALLDAIR